MIQHNDQREHERSNNAQSHAELNLYFFQAPVAMAVVKGDDHLLAVANQRFQTLVGKTKDEVLDRPFFATVPALESSLKHLLDDVILTGKSSQASEVRLTHNSKGKPHTDYFNFVHDPLKDSNGKVTGVFVSAFDVTEQVDAKLRVQESDHQLRLFADAMPMLISYIDRNERYQLYNKRYEEWFGESGDLVKGMSMLDMLGEEAYSAVRPHVARALAGERVSYESKVNYKKKGET